LILSWLWIKFYDLFCLLFIRLFRPHSSKIMLSRLARIDLCCFLYFFFWLIFLALSRLWIELKICFDMLYMRISWFRDRGHGFSILNTAKSSYFFFKKVILVPWSRLRISWINSIDSGFFNWLSPYFHHLIFCLF
jgi:hypothetical protein